MSDAIDPKRPAPHVPEHPDSPSDSATECSSNGKVENQDQELHVDGPGAVDPPVEAAPRLVHVTRRAMATEFVLMLPDPEAERVEAAVEALEQLDAIESELTIYQPQSEIARVNRLAAEQPVPVSSATFRLLQRALKWSERTEGAFDVTAGPLVEVWGFTRRRGRKPSRQEIAETMQRVGYQFVRLDPTSQTVAFERPGMAINLGAIGKGDALDRVAESLRQQGIDDFLLHGGNSSVLAAGDQQPGSERGWAVGIAHPTKPRQRLAGLWLRNQSLATSGSGKQFFHYRGQRYGHVIDPRTGYPAGDLLSLTVLLDSAADADACATGMFVLGSQWIESHSATDWMPTSIMVRSAGRQDDVVVTCNGDIRWAEAPAGLDTLSAD